MRAHLPEGTSKAGAPLPPRPFSVFSCTSPFTVFFFFFFLLVACYCERDREREMEGRKSFVDEFFPRKNETAKTAKYDNLGSIFPPLSTVAGKDSEWSSSWRKTETEGGNSWSSTGQNQSTVKKSSKPLNLYELPESCLMSSSVYYGGRDDYIPQTSTTHNSGAHHSYKKNNKEDDLENSEVATRGDWWQGSYYY